MKLWALLALAGLACSLAAGLPTDVTPSAGTDAEGRDRASEGALVDATDLLERLLRSLGDTLAGAVRLIFGGKKDG